MEILFVTDFVCPYCLVAKEALERALEATGMEANIKIQPHELTPEDRPPVDTWNDARRRAGYQKLVAPCEKLNMPMKLPPYVIPRPYTRLAFEGWFFADSQGKGNAYADTAYKAYFYEEQDIGKLEVLTAMAEKIGMDPVAFVEALEQGTYTQAQKEAADYSRNVLKTSHVPTIFVDGKEITISDYSVEEMIQILRGAENKKPGLSCNEDGCALVY